jgi:hypothetical protein
VPATGQFPEIPQNKADSVEPPQKPESVRPPFVWFVEIASAITFLCFCLCEYQERNKWPRPVIDIVSRLRASGRATLVWEFKDNTHEWSPSVQSLVSTSVVSARRLTSTPNFSTWSCRLPDGFGRAWI